MKDTVFQKLSLALLILILIMTTCSRISTNKKLSKISKSIEQISTKDDIKNLGTILSLSIETEGLKSEHRMIQSTDRRILDVNRQNEIEKEIKKLDSLKNQITKSY